MKQIFGGKKISREALLGIFNNRHGVHRLVYCMDNGRLELFLKRMSNSNHFLYQTDNAVPVPLMKWVLAMRENGYTLFQQLLREDRQHAGIQQNLIKLGADPFDRDAG